MVNCQDDKQNYWYISGVYANIKRKKKTHVVLTSQICAKPTIRVMSIDKDSQKCGADICTGIKAIIMQAVGDYVS